MTGIAAPEAGFAVRGWCPGALRPMLSGDGLVVRIRPRLGRFTGAEAAGVARAARAHGSGVIDLTSRANLQIRGVRPEAHPALIGDLDALGLVDATEALESQRNIVVTPFADEVAIALARAVEAALPGLPALPGKFGFAVDCGTQRVLAEVSADVRVERGQSGDLMLRADGMEMGWWTDVHTVAKDVGVLVRAFLEAGGGRDGRTRMADVTCGAKARGLAGLGPAEAVPVAKAEEILPGLYPDGALVGFAFGQTDAATFGALARLGPMRLTPWRMVLVEGLAKMPDLPGLITDAADPLRRVFACTGAPACPQGLAPTRAVARALAAVVPRGRSLHVSGCAKGCAHPGVADVTLVAGAGGFHPVRAGTARQAASAPLIQDHDLTAAPALIQGLF